MNSLRKYIQEVLVKCTFLLNPPHGLKKIVLELLKMTIDRLDLPYVTSQKNTQIYLQVTSYYRIYQVRRFLLLDNQIMKGILLPRFQPKLMLVGYEEHPVYQLELRLNILFHFVLNLLPNMKYQVEKLSVHKNEFCFSFFAFLVTQANYAD